MASQIHRLILIVFLISLVTAYFEVDVRSFEQLSDTEYLDFTKLKIRKDKTSKTRKFYGNVSINKKLDNSFKETIIAYVKQGGEYRKMPYRSPEKGLCDFLNEDIFFYPELAATSDFPMPVPCPVTPRVMELCGSEPSLKKLPLVIMATGDYAAECTVTKDGKIVFQSKLYASIINI